MSAFLGVIIGVLVIALAFLYFGQRFFVGSRIALLRAEFDDHEEKAKNLLLKNKELQNQIEELELKRTESNNNLRELYKKAQAVKDENTPDDIDHLISKFDDMAGG